MSILKQIGQLDNFMSSITSLATGSGGSGTLVHVATNTSTTLPYYSNNITTTPYEQPTPKPSPAYKINLIKSENGGFVMELTRGNGLNPNTYTPVTPKIYILKEIENLGRDIQNILMLEEIRQ